jgi:hypothetical protein
LIRYFHNLAKDLQAPDALWGAPLLCLHTQFIMDSNFCIFCIILVLLTLPLILLPQ